MAASMRPWIEASVQRELAAALKWLNSDYRPGKEIQNGIYSCSADKLKVQLKGKQVQVIHVGHNFSEHTGPLVLICYSQFNGQRKSPFDVVLSDSQAHIRATFDRNSTDAFEKKYGKPFTQGIIGGIIVMTRCFLVFATFFSKLRQKLTV